MGRAPSWVLGAFCSLQQRPSESLGHTNRMTREACSGEGCGAEGGIQLLSTTFKAGHFRDPFAAPAVVSSEQRNLVECMHFAFAVVAQKRHASVCVLGS